MKETGILQPFAHLAPEIRTRLYGLQREQTFAAGERVFVQGAPSSAFYTITSGRVKVTRVTPEGYETILCVRGPGELLCPVTTLDGGTQLGTAVAMTETVVLRAEREPFVALCQESLELPTVVQGACLGELRHLIRRLEVLASRNIRGRLVHTLLAENNRQASGALTDMVHLTQQELGALIGASRESVSRALARLEREGVVNVKRGLVVIRNREQLERLAGESDR